MKIGQSESGCEGTVTRINLKTVKKVWGEPQGSFSPKKAFVELKKRVEFLSPAIREKVKFVYPLKTIKEKGRWVSYFRYIPGSHPLGCNTLTVGDVNIKMALLHLKIDDWFSLNVIVHARTKKLYFIDPMLEGGKISKKGVFQK